MAHFAKLDTDNNVLAVHVVNNDVITVNGIESEQAGIDFLTNLYGYTLWKQTSYNGNIRGTYAGVGYTYNPDEDIFITPQPYPSWTRSGSFWNPPTPRPEDDKFYTWDEDSLTWIEINLE
jgi:hypothetical protein